jgi:hypothetical protein
MFLSPFRVGSYKSFRSSVPGRGLGISNNISYLSIKKKTRIKWLTVQEKVVDLENRL